MRGRLLTPALRKRRYRCARAVQWLVDLQIKPTSSGPAYAAPIALTPCFNPYITMYNLFIPFTVPAIDVLPTWLHTDPSDVSVSISWTLYETLATVKSMVRPSFTQPVLLGSRPRPAHGPARACLSRERAHR